MDNILQDSLAQQGIADSITLVTYTLKVYYTYEFRDATPSVNNFINQVGCSSLGHY